MKQLAAQIRDNMKKIPLTQSTCTGRHAVNMIAQIQANVSIVST